MNLQVDLKASDSNLKSLKPYLLGGSWVVISGVISPLTLLITSHGPPSTLYILKTCLQDSRTPNQRVFEEG